MFCEAQEAGSAAPLPVGEGVVWAEGFPVRTGGRGQTDETVSPPMKTNPHHHGTEEADGRSGPRLRGPGSGSGDLWDPHVDGDRADRNLLLVRSSEHLGGVVDELLGR